jgi:histone-lysine N-methyltransferase SETMAR
VSVIAEELNMNRETVRQIVKESSGMRKISAKMVPRILTHDQKQRRLHILSDLLRNAEMFDRVIIGDETWCFQCEREIKRQRMQWKKQNSPRPKKARTSRSQVKTMLVCFFDHMGIVHYEFIAQGQTVNQQCYLEVLTRLQESVRRKRPGIWPDKWILHHDNAPAHDALRVCRFLAMNSITKMDHPPYSPDNPLRFLALSKIKKCPEGTKIC